MQIGFDPEFLGCSTPAPQVAEPFLADLVPLDGRVVIDYTHFSLALSGSRRMARWVAWNIDGSRLVPGLRDGDDFVEDRRLAGHQILNRTYLNNRLDRGHIARRADVAWGDHDEARRANDDSFYFTNITPQMDSFNQSKRHGVWGRMENSLLETGSPDGRRICVMGGPVLADDDPPYRTAEVLVPREFWKLALYRINGELRSRGFVVTQSLDGLEALDEATDPDLAPYKDYAFSVPEIEQRAGLRFAEEIHAAAGPPVGLIDEFSLREPIEDVADIEW